MSQESGGKRADRHPKYAVRLLRYRLLDVEKPTHLVGLEKDLAAFDDHRQFPEV
jgi:hypothetical protein